MNVVSLKTFVSKDIIEIFLTVAAALVFSAIYSRSPLGVTLITLLLVSILPLLLKKVEYAVFLLVIILPFKDLPIISIIHVKRLIIWSLFTYLFIRAVTRGQIRFSQNFHRFLKYSLWFFVALAISLLKAVPELGQPVQVNPEMSLKTTIFSDGLVNLEAILLFYIAYLSLDTFQQIQRLMDVIIAVTMVVALLGIFQYYYGDPPPGIAWLFNSPESKFPHRASSVFTNPNPFGHFLAPSIGIEFIFLFFGQISKKKRFFFILPCLLLGIWGVFVSYSRAAILQVFVGIILSGMLYYLKIYRGRLSWKFFFIMVLIAGFMFSMIQYYEWYAQLRVKADILQPPYMAIYKIKAIGDSERKYVAIMALKSFLKHPVLGIGYGVFVGRNIARGTEVHNQYLKILCEGGLFGFIPFMMMILVIYQAGFKVWKQGYQNTFDSHNCQILLLSAFIGISIVLFGYLFGDYLRIISISGFLWIFAGIIFVLERLIIDNR